MTVRTLFEHFIKLLFLWGFLHFCWNEQVSMHDLFHNELWWIFLSTLKWVASSGNLKMPPLPTKHMAINSLMHMSEGRIARMKDPSHIHTHIYCVCVFPPPPSVKTVNCLQHSWCLLKVRYCVEFKILLCWAGKGVGENQTLSELGPNIQG